MRRIALVAALALVVGTLAPVPALAAGATVPATTIATTVVGTTAVPASRAHLVIGAAKVSSKPQVQYRSTRGYDLLAKPSSSARKLTKVKAGSYLVARSVKGKWVRTSHAGKVGWFPIAYARRLPQHRYETVKKTTLRSSAGKGRFVATVAKGKQVIATGRTSGRYLQLYSAGKTGWAARSQVRRTVTAKYQTRSATPLHASSVGARKLATIPADFTVASRGGTRANGRVQVEYGSKTGWVQASRVSKVALSTKTGKLSWKQSASKNISRWCRSVPITAGPGLGNYAQAGGWNGKYSERITLDTSSVFGGRLDPNHPQAVAIQFHECAHILQYRAYAYDFATMDRRQDAVYGNRNGTEHMADCMAVAMGARLSGTEKNGWTWTAGYGGKCTTKHLAAARKVIAGKRV